MKSINDLDRLDSCIKQEIQTKVAECINSGWYILGKNVNTFEKNFADYIGIKHCISVANGTQAIELSLKAIDIQNGDEVITVANAGFYSSFGILASGAIPVYADVNQATFTMNIESLKNSISNKTKAVIVTHLFGLAAEIEEIASICKKNNLYLIEDCAQAHGAKINNHCLGSFGDIGCFSFYPTKNLGAMGDGGALTTNNDKLAANLLMLRQYGWKEKYKVEKTGGLNSRLDEIQAVVLDVKLRYLDASNAKRRKIAEQYSSKIINPLIIQKPAVFDSSYVAHLYVVRTEKRDSLLNYLKNNGIPCDIHYPIPDYKQPILSEKYKKTSLKNTELLCSQIITLPCFPEMLQEEIDTIIYIINNWS